ncbi:MAG TPA: adenylate/guanylate cyclase domain-containing protein [Hyphomicrobiaceae bacterium]|nr:adenylate/guanylate cyclase domain-containing protein [Hyphomicrobiaceae bacterium]
MSVLQSLRSALPVRLSSPAENGYAANALPARVRSLIGAREAESERLIGWAQLVLTATFAALYIIAPRPADAQMAMFAPVPFALAGYAVFTGVRLWFAYRVSLPGWLLILSILADTALLLSLIWSFHIQYGQPAAFSLKVPTFIYIFVFIALRALRFDHRYVLSVGLFAALGWAVVVLLAVRSGDGSEITRNFVTYLTSNSIMIGAEFDKIFTVLMVTAILTIAVRRGQRLLVTAVREEAAGREIRRFLSRGVAEAITSAETLIEAGQGVERNAAIVMLDIRGFTRFSATVPPHEVVRMLTGFHERIVPLVHAHGGVIDKFLGDGVMATFGAVAPCNTAAADALRALHAIIEEASRWQQELAAAGSVPRLEVNGAVAAGRVVFATLGDSNRLEYTVIGEAVNLAAKLEKHNKMARTRALTTVTTYELARAQGFVADREPGHLRAALVAGVDGPIDLAVLAS